MSVHNKMLSRIIGRTLCLRRLQCDFGLVQYLSGRKVQKANESFNKEIAHMSEKETFTYNDMKVRVTTAIEDGESNWRTRLNQSAKTELLRLRDQKKVLLCLFEEELNSNKVLNKNQLEEITQITHFERDFVQKVVDEYYSLKVTHEYIRTLVKANKEMPRNMPELETGLRGYMNTREEDRVPPKKTMSYYHRHHRKMSNKQRDRMLKFDKY